MVSGEARCGHRLLGRASLAFCHGLVLRDASSRTFALPRHTLASPKWGQKAEPRPVFFILEASEAIRRPVCVLQFRGLSFDPPHAGADLPHRECWNPSHQGHPGHPHLPAPRSLILKFWQIAGRPHMAAPRKYDHEVLPHSQ